jgi:hypothetical protein
MSYTPSSPWITTTGTTCRFSAYDGQTLNVRLFKAGTDTDLSSVIARAEKAATTALRNGEILLHTDLTTKTWRTRETCTDWTDGLRPSERYTYNTSGKVRAEWVEITLTADGTRTKRKLRTVWVSRDNA